MIVSRYNDVVTTVGGSASLSIPQTTHAVLRHFYVKPATDSTTYDLVIKDKDGYELYLIEGQTGLLLEQLEIPITGGSGSSLPVVEISNATANEQFRVRSTFIELH